MNIIKTSTHSANHGYGKNPVITVFKMSTHPACKTALQGNRTHWEFSLDKIWLF